MILKTLAVDPSVRGLGLGGALMDLAQRSARELGFRRAIHALIHDSNVSRTDQRPHSAHHPAVHTVRAHAGVRPCFGTLTR